MQNIVSKTISSEGVMNMSRQRIELAASTELIRSFIAILADLLAIWTTVGVYLLGILPKGTNWILYIFLVAFSLAIPVLLKKIVSEIVFLNLLMLVAQRGHLHTLRMLLLVRNDRKNERKHLYDGSANFTFHLKKKNDTGKSTVTYHHTFEAKRKNQKKFRFSTWLFGDENIPPKIEDIRINEQSLNNKNAESVGGAICSEFPNHDGIYVFEWVVTKENINQKLQNSGKILFELKYSRENAFTWDRDDVLVIHPRSFMDGIESANISVFADPDDSDAILEVTITELSQGLHPKINGPYPMKKQEDKGAMSFYSTLGELKINEKNVYVISIRLK